MIFDLLVGVVYNITHYLSFHPGGRAELMKAAGTDCTLLFNQVDSDSEMYSFIAICLCLCNTCKHTHVHTPVHNYVHTQT